ncbi:conserved hypothetical protein [Thermosulfidibacter takaii ABI70S6]|uniref:DUF2391 family protein n=1 Tax=Thermosulfidibacter takaii (strain DSM 17441 / JCM 13301 / NBRC 103674 / ABI70S6) TaxID=1298851 RepID=A0A0S3QV39_THET7|nr:DUF2391 family protein [Thermosulfidibacter takaii]BAT72172.1 conserved hypothetical protein [Thermosulfidibacter takaii ABI70S6]
MDTKEDLKGVEEIERTLKNLEERISEINEKLEGKKASFQLKDVIQQIVGAMLLAFPFAANADIWEVSKNMTFTHALILLAIIVVGLYMVIKYGKLENWKTQNIGFVPLRLITILCISVTVSALSLVILGVYPEIINNESWFIRTVILVTLFSVMGSFGLDATK